MLIKRANVIAALCVSSVVGCANHEIVDMTAEGKALNQPHVDLIEDMSTDLDVSLPPRLFVETNPGSAVITVDEVKEELAAEFKYEQSEIFDSNWEKFSYPIIVRPFEIVEGESYQVALTNWIQKLGYARVHFVLTREDKKLFGREADETKAFIDTLPESLKQLTKWMVDTETPENFLGIYVYFSGDEATVYSAKDEVLVHHQYALNEAPKPMTTGAYRIFSGETYESALMRWLADAGYTTFGKLLTPDSQKVLSQKIQESETIYEPLSQAATLLLYKARVQAQEDPRTERQDFLTDTVKKRLEHNLYLDVDKHQAILSSSNQPVTLFNVKQGSLKDNFISMTEHFGWKADTSHYLADEYQVTFGYPIVAENGNLKTALNLLLSDYTKLRGAIVPSKREAYIVMER